MTIEQVADMLGQILNGEITLDQVVQIRQFLHAGIDITSLMM